LLQNSGRFSSESPILLWYFNKPVVAFRGGGLVDIQIAIEQQIPGCWPKYDDTDDRYVMKDPVPFAGWPLHFKSPEETEQDAP
jgi:hypothetical protein